MSTTGTSPRQADRRKRQSQSFEAQSRSFAPGTTNHKECRERIRAFFCSSAGRVQYFSTAKLGPKRRGSDCHVRDNWLGPFAEPRNFGHPLTGPRRQTDICADVEAAKTKFGTIRPHAGGVWRGNRHSTNPIRRPQARVQALPTFGISPIRTR